MVFGFCHAIFQIILLFHDLLCWVSLLVKAKKRGGKVEGFVSALLVEGVKKGLVSIGYKAFFI